MVADRAAVEPNHALKFRLHPLDEIELPTTTPDLVRGLLPRTGLAVVYGPPGCGKSFLVLDVTLHIAAGRDWAGRRVRQAGVVYVAAEAGEGFKRRVVAARDRLELLDAEFALITAAPNLGVATGDTTALVQAIRVQSLRLGWKPGVVVLDTLARVIPGVDENSAKEIGRFVANAETIGRELRCLVLAVHHQGKNAEAGMRGSSALHGAADAEWSISIDGGVRTVRLSKLKEGADDLAWTFDLEAIEAGRDEEDEPITTCIVARVAEPAFANASKRPQRTTVPASLKLFTACLENALADHGADVRPWGGEGGTVRAVVLDRVRDEFLRSHAAEKQDTRRKAFDRALGAASTSKLIVSADLGDVTHLWRP